MKRVRSLTALATLLAAAPSRLPAQEVDYLTQIKPLLAARCYACHSALRQRSGLRLDTAALLAAGGDSGPAIEPGHADESRLTSMLTGASGSRMPPEGEGEALDPAQIELFRKWIGQGAPAPEEPPPPDPRDHWAFQPPIRPAAPQVADAAWAGNPIDAFVAASHQSHGVTPAGPAAKAVLLRRVYLDLSGLPPTREELHAFLADDSPQAYEAVVDRLLASPQYGERWGRHWMDVWRYSDWSGFEQEIRNSARHIWRWRDWIVESLNADKGYDQMVREMLAGDELAPEDPEVLRATGFLARNWYKFNRNAWLDNTVEHTAKAFLGVTIACARCHDHKYDPISQANYYQMRAIFEPHHVRTDCVPGQPDVAVDGLPRVVDLKPAEPTYLFTRGNERQPEKDHPLTAGVPEVLKGALRIEPIKLPVTAYYPALCEFAVQEDSAKAAQVVVDCEAALSAARAALADAKPQAAEATPADLQAAVAAAEGASRALATARAAQTALRARVAAEKAKYRIHGAGNLEQLALAAGKAERELALHQVQERHAAAEAEWRRARDAAAGGDPAAQPAVAEAAKKVDEAGAALAAAHAALAQPSPTYQPLGEVLPDTSTGRRLAFANWIVDRENPLAARVAVNHLWLRHFGSPLVDNMFDFGVRSPSARNQPLLDWLAVELMEHRWQMKHLHRLMVTSSAYRMASSGGAAAAANAAIDPDNRLLWRMNARRLEAEAVRDSMLYVAGNLDLTLGGADIDCQLASQTPRRSIYLRHAYEKQAKFLELFDGASVNECYRRSESVVPQQALALANSDLSLVQSRQLAGRLVEAEGAEPATDVAFITRAFEQILSRAPSADEAAECRGFLDSQTQLHSHPEKLTPFTGGAKIGVDAAADPRQRARENLVHVLYNHNDFVTIR